MNPFCVIFICLFFAAPGFARIGETMAECEARYGPRKGRTGAFQIFTKNRINAECEFGPDGQCRLILFSAETELDLGTIDALLQANSGNSKWKEFETFVTKDQMDRVTELLESSKGREWASRFRRGRNWFSEDGHRCAVFRDGHLIIATFDALDAYRAASVRKASGF